MAVFLSFEAMFFAGLIGAFLVFRLGSQVWPPAGQPRLPILVTSINTVILLISGYTMVAARRAARTGEWRGALPALSATAVLGGIFLSVQGSEWVRLIEHGLTLSAGVYGATFYTLIGCHALHVLGAVIWLLVVRFRAAGGALLRGRDTGFELCAAYWYFVVALWLVLFPLVYLF
jgi:cytochrome c oxidase subunit 3